MNEVFDQTVQSVHELLHCGPTCDGVQKDKFEEFVLKKWDYELYLIQSIPGHRGQKGSVFTEINHSSFLSYLKNGNNLGNEYNKHLVTMMKDLLKHQEKQF